MPTPISSTPPRARKSAREIARIYGLLDRLPRDERLVWVLRFVEGETLESIAALLDASVSTVQRRLRTAEVTMGVIR